MPHRDPSLHGRDGGEHEDTGAVACCVDTAGRGARHAVDDDEAAIIDLDSRLGEAEVLGVGNRAEGEQGVAALDGGAVAERDDDTRVATSDLLRT